MKLVHNKDINKDSDLKQQLSSVLIIAIMISSSIFTYFNLYQYYTASGASSWTHASESDFINGTFNNTTIVGIGENAEIRLDFSEINEWTNKTSTIYPNARCAHTLASIFGDDKIILFGGTTRTWKESRNDTWIYDFSNNTWTNRTPPLGPSIRSTPAMASIYGDDKVILFGGGKESANFYNDTWEYDLSNNTWTQRNLYGLEPTARYGHAMASVWGDDKIVLFGGIMEDNNHSNDTWIYDSSNGLWINITPKINTSNYPSWRYGHGMASIYGQDKVVLFGGGLTGSGGLPILLYNDTWVYDLNEKNWTKKNTTNTPPTRMFHAMASIPGDDKVILFGGLYWTNWYCNDTWIYDLSENSWREIHLNNSAKQPGGGYGIEMASIYGTGYVLLFGGIKNVSQFGYYNETWVYKHNLSAKNGIYISNPYDTYANSSFKILNWNGKMPDNTSIEFQLRTARYESNLYNKDFIGPDGTPATFYISSPANIWQGHYGNRWVQYKAYLNRSIFSASPWLKNVTISYNCLPDTTVIGPANASLIHANKPTFAWTFEDLDSNEQKEFQLLIDEKIGFQSIDYNSGPQSSSDNYWQFPNGTSYLELPEGKWYWKVRTKDSDGDWGSYSTPFKFIIDTGIPYSNIIIPVNNTYYRNLDIISGTASDSIGGTGLDRVEILIKDLNEKMFWNGLTWNSSESWLKPNGVDIWSYDVNMVTWSSGNLYCVQSRAIDLARNIENPYQRKIFTLDNEDVIFSDPFPLFDNESPTGDIQVGITISDNTSGVNVSAIRYSTSTNVGNYWSSWKIVDGYSNGKTVNVKLNLTFPNGTDNRIRWRAYDIAGNGPAISDEFIVKVNIPEELVLPDVQLLTPENNSIISKSSIDLSWRVTNTGLKNVKFDVYVDMKNPPKEIVQDNLTDSNLQINELDNNKKYYWTVIPKIKDRVGFCISGVWSFSVEIPIPRVKLTTPENGSVIKSISPTLVWELDYNGSDKVTYELYFGTTSELELEMDKIPATHFSIFDLDDNTTYYWYIVPWAGEIKGPRSEVWSFIVNLSEDTSQPNFDIDLVVYPSTLELALGDKSFAKATVTNLGDSKDNVSLKLWIPTEKGIEVIFNGSNTSGIAAGYSYSFDLTVIADIDAIEDTVQITVVAESNFAKKYNLTIRKLAILTVRIKEPMTGNGDSDEPTFELTSWNILTILILIIILIIILIVILNRKKLMEKKDKILIKESTEKKTIEETQEPQSVENNSNLESHYTTELSSEIETKIPENDNTEQND